MARMAPTQGQLSSAERKAGSHMLAKSSSSNVSTSKHPTPSRSLPEVLYALVSMHSLLVHRAAYSISAQSNGPPTLPLSTMLTAATVSFGQTEQLDQDDIEAMCASLMEQGYIKAYIWQSKGMMVLQKGDRLGFPAVSTVRMHGDDA